jgi:exodeoxyribonuclease V alpha subunit
MTVVDVANRDPFEVDVARAANGLLAEFNLAGVLAPADVHVAQRLGKLCGEDDERVILAAALAVRGPRFGHVRTGLRGIRSTVIADVEDRSSLDALSWPDDEQWIGAVAASRLVAVGEDGPAERPLRLIDDALYLDRYWRDECFIAGDILRRCSGRPPAVDETLLHEGLGRLFGDESSEEQRRAAAVALTRRFAVVAGGPGTGKTTTVARIIALLHEQSVASRARPPLIALAAPTGKAAARMEEAVRESASRLALSEEVRARLRAAEGLTIHRLLRKRPDSSSRFRHDRHNRLPHDVVIVDETSMVSLSLMARLLEAVRDDAQVILVGDPEQLASVEAGAVLGDIVGPAAEQPLVPRPAPGAAVVPASPPSSPVAQAIVMLRSNFRFRGPLAALAGAIRRGDSDATIDVLSGGDPAVRWIDLDVSEAVRDGWAPAEIRPVRDTALAAGRALFDAALSSDGGGALGALATFRLLCAHRRGAAGVEVWTRLVETWLSEEVEGFDPDPDWYPGRPVMITANDYGLRLFNGDTGAVVVRAEGGLGVVFPRGDSVVTVSPSRLSAVETVFATTVHKSQGSEFEDAALILPAPDSPLLTRELLYTAVTRAKRSLTVVGPEESLRAAVARPIARASGLTVRLWA